MSSRITNILKILFIFAVHLSLGGGIGRRARLKLVFFGVWVRFPPKVQTPHKLLRGFLYPLDYLIAGGKHHFSILVWGTVI